MAIVLSRRFAELIDQYAAVAATAHTSGGINGGTLRLVDGAKLLGWLTKVKSLLRQACGDDSAHLENFSKVEKDSSWWTGSADKAALYFEILKAAQEDYDGGYLESIRTMVSAEVFASELEQAEELLRNHYHVAAAVIAGTVLETTVRALADRHGVAKASLNRKRLAVAS